MTDELTPNSSTAEPTGFPPLGEVLRSARNAKSLTLKEVSNNLRLSVKQIEALENDDFLVLPPPMITRGFIRNYARLLEVNAEPLLESYRARMPETGSSRLRVQTSVNQEMLGKKSRFKLKHVLGSALILLGLVSWFFYTDYKTKLAKQPTETVNAEASKNTAAELVPLPEIALPAAERDAASSVAVSPEAAAVDNAQAIPNEKVAVAGTAAAANLAQSVKLRPSTDVNFNMLKENSTQSAQTRAATASEANTRDMTKTNDTIDARKNVSLSVSGEVWVQVTDKSGAVIYEKMLAANTQDSIDGQPPFNLLIGNAKATTVTFLGKPVDLSKNTKNNVARITLE